VAVGDSAGARSLRASRAFGAWLRAYHNNNNDDATDAATATDVDFAAWSHISKSSIDEKNDDGDGSATKRRKSDAFLRAGNIVVAVFVDVPPRSAYTSVTLVPTGRFGLLPNLDLVSTITTS
jgi:hypothetical protein